MPRVTRRTALRGSAALLAAVGAGCASRLRDASEPTSVKEISVWNGDPEPHAVHALLLEGGDPVCWESVDVDPYSPDGDVFGGAEFEEFPSEPGAYRLYVWRDDQPRSAWEELDLREYELPCTKVVVMIGERRRGEVTLHRSAGCPNDGDGPVDDEGG